MPGRLSVRHIRIDDVILFGGRFAICRDRYPLDQDAAHDWVVLERVPLFNAAQTVSTELPLADLVRRETDGDVVLIGPMPPSAAPAPRPSAPVAPLSGAAAPITDFVLVD